MSLDWNMIEEEISEDPHASVNFEDNCSYIVQGYIKKGNKLSLKGIRKLAGFKSDFQFQPFIKTFGAYDQLILGGITSTQYGIILTWDNDLKQTKLYPPKDENHARELCRPLLIFNQENSEKHSGIIDMTSENSIYKFEGLAFLKSSEDGSYYFFEKAGDFCNIPIINKTC